MIRRIRKHVKRSGVPTWALVLMFAVAPALSSAFAAPAGSFAQTIIHSHAHGDEPHSHHHHHDHERADSGIAGDLGLAQDSQSGHSDHDRVHVHYDASCPSIMVPTPVSLELDQELGAAVEPRPTRALRGSSPSRLLRPPIV